MVTNCISYILPEEKATGLLPQWREEDFTITTFTYKSDNNWTLFGKCIESIDNCSATNTKPPVILLHGGGPNHESLLPLAKELAHVNTVILPDVRGYGRSVCTDPKYHTWSQYADDVISLMSKISAPAAIVGGAGMGATISLRVALAYPKQVDGLVLISVEDIEDDNAKAAEIAFMEDFANRVRKFGIEKAWQPILGDLAPVIRSMVVEAIPGTNRESLAAAASIGYDRSFRSKAELSSIAVPTLIFPGMDWRHPEALAKEIVEIIPKGKLAPLKLSAGLKTKDDFAAALAPSILWFLNEL